MTLNESKTWELNGWNFVKPYSMPNFSEQVLLLIDENSSAVIGTLEVLDERRQWYINGEMYQDIYDFNFWRYLPEKPKKYG